MVAFENQIIAIRPRLADGRFGDGIVVMPLQSAQPAFIINEAIRESSRAALSNFGNHVELTNVALQCAAFELEGEDVGAGEFGPGIPATNLTFSFADNGGNLCGCPTANSSCVAVSVGLAPPESAAPMN